MLNERLRHMTQRHNILHQKFGDWFCAELTERHRPSQKTRLWKTICKCGNIGYNTSYDLINCKSTKCKVCATKEQKNKSKYAVSYKYVYFVRSGKYIKIGASNNVENRLLLLQSGSPEELELLYTFNFSDYNERFFHELFKDFSYRGEWFLMTKEDCESRISKLY